MSAIDITEDIVSQNKNILYKKVCGKGRNLVIGRNVKIRENLCGVITEYLYVVHDVTYKGNYFKANLFLLDAIKIY